MSMHIGTTPEGPGKYGEEAAEAYRLCEAGGLCLIVFNGSKGNGFSCILTPEMAPKLPDILRNMANQIDEDMRKTVEN